MKTLLTLLLLVMSSLAQAWQPGDLQENFSDIRAAQEYGRQQIENQNLQDQQFRQQQQIEQIQRQQQQNQQQQWLQQNRQRNNDEWYR